MTEKSASTARVSVGLTGRMLQFNISLLVLSAFDVVVLGLACGSKSPVVMYLGAGTALLGVVGVIGLAIWFYTKQKSRPLDGQSVGFSIRDGTGKEISVRNPPDAFFEERHFRALARSVLVGYDENMCPDGEVIGKASEGRYRLYSPEEKADFVKRHREQIQGQRSRVAMLLERNEAVDGQGPSEEGRGPGEVPVKGAVRPN